MLTFSAVNPAQFAGKSTKPYTPAMEGPLLLTPPAADSSEFAVPLTEKEGVRLLSSGVKSKTTVEETLGVKRKEPYARVFSTRRSLREFIKKLSLSDNNHEIIDRLGKLQDIEFDKKAVLVVARNIRQSVRGPQTIRVTPELTYDGWEDRLTVTLPVEPPASRGVPDNGQTNVVWSWYVLPALGSLWRSTKPENESETVALHQLDNKTRVSIDYQA